MQFIELKLLCTLTALMGSICILVGVSWWIASDTTRVNSRISRVGVGAALLLLAAVLVFFEDAWVAALLVALLLVYAFARRSMPKPQVRLMRGTMAVVGGGAIVALSVASLWVWIPAYGHWTKERNIAAIAEHSVALIDAAQRFQREQGRPPDSISELRSMVALSSGTLDAPYGFEYHISPSEDFELLLIATHISPDFGDCVYAPVREDGFGAAGGLGWNDEWELRCGNWIYVAYD